MSEAEALLPDRAYEHLDPRAIELLDASPERRKQEINFDFFVPYPLATELLKAMQWRMELPPGPRRPSISLGGASGLGKSHIIKEFMLQCGVDLDTGIDSRGEKPILVMECTGIRSAKLFRERFWKFVGGSPGKSDDIYDGCLIIKRSKARFIVLDEAHTLRNVKPVSDYGLITDYIKLICNVSERPIMLVGDVNVGDVIQSDTHLLSRFKHWRITAWDNIEDLREFVNPIIARFPLPEPSPITDDQTLALIISETQGITESIVVSLRRTAVKAIDGNLKKITRDDWLTTLRSAF